MDVNLSSEFLSQFEVTKSTHLISSAMLPFVILFAWRYLRFIVHCISFYTFKPIPLPSNPAFTEKDVTVIVPTIATSEEKESFTRCLRGMLESGPQGGIIVVTTDAQLTWISRLGASLSKQYGLPVNVVTVGCKGNKRKQVSCAVSMVQTAITVCADDDVVWPKTFLPYVLAPFDNPQVGAVGPSQRIRKEFPSPGFTGRVWEYLGACYIERRNFDTQATYHIDGGVSTLSGRTQVLRTSILASEEFRERYDTETFNGRLVTGDDDKFVTRFLVNKGWKIVIQSANEATIQTTLECNRKFLFQCARWSRTRWRSNLRSMFVERRIWTAQPWCAYAVHLTTLTQFALVVDPLMIYLLFSGLGEADDLSSCLISRGSIIGMFVFWILLTKFVKLIPHYKRYPGDVCYFPVTVLFGYFHSFIKLWTLLTVNSMTWGSRADAEEDAVVAEERESKLVENIMVNVPFLVSYLFSGRFQEKFMVR
jgi:cellulose synthase/poly-beta-1,6-N-acetylglucosamine synthase-like glycosyltransferase